MHKASSSHENDLYPQPAISSSPPADYFIFTIWKHLDWTEPLSSFWLWLFSSISGRKNNFVTKSQKEKKITAGKYLNVLHTHNEDLKMKRNKQIKNSHPRPWKRNRVSFRTYFWKNSKGLLWTRGDVHGKPKKEPFLTFLVVTGTGLISLDTVMLGALAR